MISAKRLSLLMLCVNLAACVTVNIYFPEAAAQKALAERPELKAKIVEAILARRQAQVPA